MVGSYLICDECGQFGPPASFLSKNGLRLCYRCWYQERLSDDGVSAENGANRSRTRPPIQSPHLKHNQCGTRRTASSRSAVIAFIRHQR